MTYTSVWPIFNASSRSTDKNDTGQNTICGFRKFVMQFCQHERRREARLEGGGCRREQAGMYADRQAGSQARDAGTMANGCIARARRRDTDASPSGAKAKTAEWNYSCSIVYNGRINGLNRRRTIRSLFVIAQRSAAGKSYAFACRKSHARKSRRYE